MLKANFFILSVIACLGGCSAEGLDLLPSAVGEDEAAEDIAEHEPVALGAPTLPPKTCTIETLKLRWPLDGQNGRDWFCNNFVDLDPSTNREDYEGFTGNQARTYDGHDGVDISIPNFRGMDSATAVVRAAASGKIVAVRDDQPDRNQLDSLENCTHTSNRVIIEHENGTRTYYGHLKRNSVTHKVGDPVSAGTIIGIVGSSGCSTRPHLHFEAQDCSGTPVDSHQLGLWISPPEYEPASAIMDLVFKRGTSLSVKEIVDPERDHKYFAPGADITIGASVASRNGDRFECLLKNQDGTILDSSRMTFFVSHMRNRTQNCTLTLPNETGTYQIDVLLNGTGRSRRFEVRDEHVVVLPLRLFQEAFDELREAGYFPVWFDIYDGQTEPNVAAVFRLKDGRGWRMRWNLSAETFETALESLPGINRHAAQIDTYRSGSTVRYALLEYQGPQDFRYVIGKPRSEYQASFDANQAAGFRPVNVATTTIGSATYYTALFNTRPIGSWQCRSNLTPSDFEALSRENADRGRTVSYFNAFDINGSPRFNVIFSSEPKGKSEMRIDLTRPLFDTEVFELSASGEPRRTYLAAGYRSGSSMKLAGMWTEP